MTDQTKNTSFSVQENPNIATTTVVYREVMFVSENKSGHVSVVVSQEALADLPESDRNGVIRGLLTLSLAQLSTELTTLHEDSHLLSLEVSPAVESDVVLSMRMLVGDEGEFQLLTYFGEAMPEDFLMIDGLKRAIFIVNALREELEANKK